MTSTDVLRKTKLISKIYIYRVYTVVVITNLLNKAKILLGEKIILLVYAYLKNLSHSAS